MSCEFGYLSERRISPNYDLVLGIAMGTDQLIGTLGPS